MNFDEHNKMKNQIYLPIPAQNNKLKVIDQHTRIDSIPVIAPRKKTTIDLTNAHKLSRNFVEIPEMVFVETRFITHNATQNAMEMPYTLDVTNFKPKSKPENDKLPLQTTPTTPVVPVQKANKVVSSFAVTSRLHKIPAVQHQRYRTFANAAVCARVNTTEVSTETDAPVPTRSRALQTEQPSLVDAGIQCNFESDYDENDFICKPVVGDKNDTKEAFLKYTTENTVLYSNGMRECFVCGEIASKEKAMLSHMALHWGPSVLCSSCGIKFEHEKVLNLHNCDSKLRTERKKRKLIKCPHFRCPVSVISLHELYDHINEHTAESCFRCGGCTRTFNTAGELRHHIPLRLKCLEFAKRQRFPYKRWSSKIESAYRIRVHTIHSIKRNRVLVKSFLSQHTLKRFCLICQLRCTNAYKYQEHTKRCLKKYLVRLNKKRFVANENK